MKLGNLLTLNFLTLKVVNILFLFIRAQMKSGNLPKLMITISSSTY